jgi:UDP-glucose-4-epimerase GalE
MHAANDENPRVLVTGGAGYIGSHTCKALATAGFEPITVDNLSTGHRWAVKWGPLLEIDLADPAAIASTLGLYRPAAVIHFAASAYVGESITNPRKYFRNNVQNTLNLLDAMVDAGVNRIVFSSTCATYGIPEVVPIPETHAQRPINPYGESKLFLERALYWYGQAYGLRSWALRYFNAAGADSEGDLGEDHVPETHLIPLAIGAALGTHAPLKILGTDYPTPDGTCIRDYIHVSDLAEAHLAALRALFRRGSAKAATLNLGTGIGHSVLEVTACIRNVLGKDVPSEFASRRPGDPPRLVAQSSARATIDWSPRCSALAHIVESACRWQAVQRSSEVVQA